MKDEELQRHNVRIGYLEVLSRFPDVTAAQAISYSDALLKEKEVGTIDNPDLSEIKDQIARMQQENDERFNQYTDPDLSRDFPAAKLGEIVSKADKIVKGEGKKIEIKTPFKEAIEETEKEFKANQSQSITPAEEFPGLDMVDPKARKKEADQKPQQKVVDEERAPMPMPVKYEDRMKLVESQAFQPRGTGIEPGTDKFDSRGMGESGGEINKRGN